MRKKRARYISPQDILSTILRKEGKVMEENKVTTQAELDERIAKLDETIAKISAKLEAQAEAKAPAPKAKDNGLRIKAVITMATTFILVISLAVCTYAYFVATTTSSGNIISTGRAAVTLHNTTDPSYPSDPISGAIFIMPGYSVGKNVYAENNGVYPLYVRAKIESTITLNERYADHQSEIDKSLVSYSIDLDNWTERDGYYYYNTSIGAAETTTNLLSSVDFSTEMGNIYKDSTIKVTILLESVQSNGNGNTVFDAVGWSSAEEGGTP